jgi:hypothetical protein
MSMPCVLARSGPTPVWRWIAALGLLLSLGACSSAFDKEALADHERLQKRTVAANNQLRSVPDATASAPLVLEKSLSFTRRSVPFDASQLLPTNIQTVTMRTTGQYGLRSVAEWIERLTRIPVLVSPDALMPISAFALDTTVTGGAPASGAASPRATEAQAGADGKGVEPNRAAALAIEAGGGPRLLAAEQDPALISVDYHGPLQGLLDQVAARAGVHWSYQGGSIRFFRVVSRTITLRTLPGNVNQTGGIQLSSGISTTADVEVNIWTGIERTLQQMVSRQGRFRVDPALGQVTVRDALHNVEAVERYLDSVNRLLARQVSLSVEVLQVNLNNRFETGIDWNYVRQYSTGLFSAGALPVVTGSTASVGFVRSNDGAPASTLIVRALESFGRVSTAYSSVINTMNRQPVPLGSISTQSYLRQITPTATTNSAGTISFGPPGLTPGEISTGFNMTLLPIVLDSNRVLVQFGVSISSLKDLVPFTSGTGLAQQTVQQPNVSTFQTLQRMAVRSGDTIVLSGFETESADLKQNDIKRDVLPGTRATAREKSSLVVLITPRLLEF